MDWSDAKEGTLTFWHKLRGSVEDLDEVELLKEINAVNELCDKARLEAHGELNRCNYCIAYHQFGGCMGVSLRMSECVVDGKLDELKDLMSQFIHQLEALEIPPEAEA
jgi:hypothetical protein